MAALGDSFMLPKPGQDTEQLWVLVTQPDPQTHATIMVNLTTQRPHSDTTTILAAGDHPFVQRPSVIYYADARIVDARQIAELIAREVGRSHAAFSPAVLRRIQAGLPSSQFTPCKIKDAYASAVENGLT